MRLRTFSLRTGLILFLLFGTAMGLAARWYHEVRERGRANLRISARSKHYRGLAFQKARLGVGLARIPRQSIFPIKDSLGMYVISNNEGEPSWTTKLFRDWIHPEYQQKFEYAQFEGHRADRLDVARDFVRCYGVRDINIHCARIDPKFASILFRSPGLESLEFSNYFPDSEEAALIWRQVRAVKRLEEFAIGGRIVREAQAREIVGIRNLRSLRVQLCSPDALSTLAGAPHLEELYIEEVRHSASKMKDEQSKQAAVLAARDSIRLALDQLAKKPTFKTLRLCSSVLPLEAEDISQFCRSSKVEMLHFESPQIAPNCFKELAQLPAVKKLVLYSPAIRDDHIQPLAKTKSLMELSIGPNISSDSAAKLKQSIPACSLDRLKETDNLRIWF